MDKLNLVDLPSALLAEVCNFLPPKNIGLIEQLSHFMNAFIQSQNVWYSVSHQSFYHKAHPNSYQWKKLIHKRYKNSDVSIIKSVEGCSSRDREDERPENTLIESQCYLLVENHPGDPAVDGLTSRMAVLFNHEGEMHALAGESYQTICGCALGQSCYWSSASSVTKNNSQYLDYLLFNGYALKSVSVTPYRAFWHPQCPSYGPQQVQFELFHQKLYLNKDKCHPYYVSPVYDMENDMKKQQFILPKAVILDTDSILRVRLLGYVQPQTLVVRGSAVFPINDDSEKIYYICISNVHISGVPLS